MAESVAAGPDPARYCAGGGIARAFRRDRQRRRAQFLMGNQSEIGAIHTAAESNDTGAHLLENSPQMGLFFMQHRWLIVAEALDKKAANSKYKA